jgi:hypothetical protein
MGLTYNATKYVRLCNPHKFKSLSLEDNVYFTLRDIFMNAKKADDAIECNEFNHQLTNEIGFEDRTDTFTYTNVLQDKAFVEGLIKWLCAIKPSRDFFFTDEIDEDDVCTFNSACDMLTTKWKYSDDKCEYITLDSWMENLNELRSNLLPKRISELNDLGYSYYT